MKLCLNCNKPIKKTRHYNKLKFCGRSCSASYNNRLFPKRKRTEKTCTACGTKYTDWENLVKCPDCRISKWPNGRPKNTLLTKGEVSKQTITQHARSITKDWSKICGICQYDKHINVCHIKDRKLFDDSTLVTEINSLDNLILLCPNHHWEFDNDML